MTWTELSADPAVRALGWTVLHSSWQGALIALAAGLLARLLPVRVAAPRYRLFAAALALVPIFGLVTWCRLRFPAGAVEPAALGASGLAAQATPGALRLRADAYAPIVAALWSGGVLGVAAWHLVGLFATIRLPRTGVRPVGERWHGRLAPLARSLGVTRAVGLRASARVDAPSVVGWRTPTILLPTSSFSRLSERQLDLILTHELAHVRRGDVLASAFQTLVDTLLFFHPFARWLSRAVRLERESCCDDLVIDTTGRPLEYARALERIESLRSVGSLGAVAANGGSLLRRVRRLLEHDEPGGAPPRRRAFAGVFALTGLAGATVGVADATVVLASGLPPAARDGASGFAQAAGLPGNEPPAAGLSSPRSAALRAAEGDARRGVTRFAHERTGFGRTPTPPMGFFVTGPTGITGAAGRTD